MDCVDCRGNVWGLRLFESEGLHHALRSDTVSNGILHGGLHYILINILNLFLMFRIN